MNIVLLLTVSAQQISTMLTIIYDVQYDN